MPTLTTVPSIILLMVLWRLTKGQILPSVLFTSIFTAASVLNLGVIGVAPWLFTLAACLVLKLLTGHKPYRFTMGANKAALHLMIVFLAYTAFTGFVYPVLFRGVTVMRTGDAEPLAWGPSNIAQLCYLAAAAVLYFLAVSSTREELQQAMDWYVRGCITAAGFAMYQLLNAIAHVPYPEGVLYSNKSHVVYRAYMIGGMWRLNSTFNEASEMAGFMIVGLALLGWTMVTTRLSAKRICCFALMLVSLLMTMSSVGYLCLGYTVLLGIAFALRNSIRNGGLSAGKLILGFMLATGLVTMFTLSTKAVDVVEKVVTSTVLDKRGSDSYKERAETHEAALETLSQTDYMGAGWGSIRASGLIYVLLGTIGVPGLLLFLAFVASLFTPLFRRRAQGSPFSDRDMIEKSLFAMSTLFLAMVVAGAEPVAPVLWVLFGVATVAQASANRKSGPAVSTLPVSMHWQSTEAMPAPSSGIWANDAVTTTS